MGSKAVRLFIALAVAATLATGLSATSAQAAEGRAPTTSRSDGPYSLKKIDQRLMSAAEANGDGTASPMVVADAVRVCAPNKCVWVEKTNYCSSSMYCGQDIVTRVATNPNPSYCPAGYRCWTTAYGRFKTLSGEVSGMTNAELSSWVQCGVDIGLGAGVWLTRGWGYGAALGVGWAVWGCAH